VFGFNGSRLFVDDSLWWEGLTDLGPINVYDHDAGSVPHPYTVGMYTYWTYVETEALNQGLYTAGRFSLTDTLKMILGARHSRYKLTEGGATAQKEDGVFTPYAGFVYDINSWASAYASYSEIFEPKAISVKNTSGNVLEPTVGGNYEVGIKGEFFAGRLNASVGIFQLEQSKLAEEDGPFDPGNVCQGQCYKESGLVTSKGLDVAIAGEVLDGLDLMAGFSYINHEYASGAQKGDPFNTRAPEQIFKFATAYTFPDEKWTIGANLRYQSDIYAEGNSVFFGTPFRIDQQAYTIVGLMGKYRFNDRSQMMLNVDNVFDKVYYAGITDPTYSNTYGEPRNFSLSYRLSF
jgi:outer membrane receptor for ferric coprogen and ferric-rhodotorulic acid